MSEPFLSKEDCREKLAAVIEKAVNTGAGVGLAFTKGGDLIVNLEAGGCRCGNSILGTVGPNCSYLDILDVLDGVLPLPRAVNYLKLR